jgi:3-phenylpropionate/trans-cinnamate dioxygenase ferredoxin reductase subunit
VAAAEQYDVIVVGGGKAASQLAASLRDEGYSGSVLIIGEETHEPYDRPPLSKGFLGAGGATDGLMLREPGYYLGADIAMEVGTHVVSIDPEHRRVQRTDGSWVSYGELVLATGARVRRLSLPGVELAGVTGLRNIFDAEMIRAALAPGRRIVVIGGGFVGLEVAASAAADHGCTVTVLEALPRLLSRTALPETAAAILEHHRALGVETRLGAQIERLRGEDGHVVAVVMADGSEIPADLVVYGVGVEPRIELAADAGIAVDNGIVVDHSLHTSAEHVWAIGDCCVFPSEHFGGPIRLESVQNATDQARHLALGLLTGERLPYRAVPWFWSDQAALKFQSVGLLGDRDATHLIGDPESGSFSVLAYRGGSLIGGDSVNASGDHLALRRLLGSGTREWESALLEAMTQPGFSLGRFARTALGQARSTGVGA